MSRRKQQQEYVSPFPTAFSVSSNKPEAIQREEVTRNQKRYDENTILWGQDDAFPIRILDAVNKSPTTTSCLNVVENYIRGAGFEDEELERIVINKDGTTLYDLHCQLSNYMAYLDGFAVNFKFDSQGKITNSYLVPLETVRFVIPKEEGNRNIDYVKVNPYFGTGEYLRRFTKKYPLWNPSLLEDQIATEGTKFPGQIYFYGALRSPYKFYPVPKYWTGEQWIYVDASIQTFHKENLDNGFFQSVLLNMIGDPNLPSKNPQYQTIETGTDGTKRPGKPTRTIGQEFTEQMSNSFSGVKKAGSVFTMWSLNKEQSASLQSFPVNAQFDVMSGTFTDSIRGITIATGVPAILANLPNAATSLGGDGNTMKIAIELMQSKTSSARNILEGFYNNILLPNLQNEKYNAKKVKIINYTPLGESSIDYYNFHAFELYWQWMDDNQKSTFLQTNVPEIPARTGSSQPQPATQIDPNTSQPIPGQNGMPAPDQGQINEALKALKLSDINKIVSIVGKVSNGQLTPEQGTQILKGYGLTDDQIMAWLIPVEA